MTPTMTWQRIDGARLTEDVTASCDRLDATEGEMFLDFSAVQRLDPAGLGAVKALAQLAEQKSVKVIIRGVNVDVYKVLKLARLTSRFSFVN